MSLRMKVTIMRYMNETQNKGEYNGVQRVRLGMKMSALR